MSTRHATMYFEDDPETGGIDFRVDYFGPIDLRSHSHNMASQVVSWLNSRADTIGRINLTPAEPDAAAGRTTSDDRGHR
jgi:hypothetical protein